MGELHLDIIADRLEREFKVGVNKGAPQVSYRESISGKGHGENTVRREIAGKSQFGQCSVHVEPIEHGNEIKVEFKRKTVLSLKKFMRPLNKVFMIQLQVVLWPDTRLSGSKCLWMIQSITTLNQTKWHIRLQPQWRFKEACQKAGLVLMEPEMNLEVITPSEYAGDVIADINAKRGKILGIEPKNNKDVLKAEVPLSGMFGYSTQLRSRTQGRASFTLTFKRYEALTNNQAKEILLKRGIYI